MSKTASRVMVVALFVALSCSSSDDPSTKGEPPYTYEGCESDDSTCPGRPTFACAMQTIAAKYNHCSSRYDCLPANIPAATSCVSWCARTLVNRDQADLYTKEAMDEVYRYCTGARCQGEVNCPRAVNETPDCLYGICVWSIGVMIDAGPQPGGDL